MTRKELDHERYMRNREERLQRQREYYIAHPGYWSDYRKERVRIAKRKLLETN